MIRRTVGLAAACALAMAVLGVPSSHAQVIPHSVVVNPDPANWTPHALGTVKAFAQVGNKIIAGGDFRQALSRNRSITYERTYLFAFDATTGVVDPSFAPVLDGEVLALEAGADGQSVYAGGSFTMVNGVAKSRLVKLDTNTGQIISAFKAAPRSKVRDLSLRGNVLYVGGDFTKIGSVDRSRLGAVDATSGAVLPSLNLSLTDPRAGGVLNVYKLDVTPDGSTMVIVGNFQKVGGLDRNQVAVIDLTASPASVTGWQTTSYVANCSASFDTYMRDIDISPDGTWFAIVTTGGPGGTTRLCDSAARWELTSMTPNQVPTWVDYTGGDSLYAVAVTGEAVYVGGHQRWMNNPAGSDSAGPGAVSRPGLAALDPVNGMPLTWNPTRTRGEGVFVFLSTPTGLWMGHDTDRVGNFEYHAGLAFFPVSGGAPIPDAVPGVLPGSLHQAGWTDNQLTKRSFDGTTAGTPSTVEASTWSSVRGAFWISGKLYTGWSNGTFQVQDYDGTTLGPRTTVNLNGLTSSQFPVSSLTGMFYENGKLYYTRGDAQLYYRYFEPQSQMVGGQQFVASGNGDGFNWSSANGTTMASGRLYYTTPPPLLIGNGSELWQVDWANGRPVPGTAVRLYSTGWASRAMFVTNP